MASRSVTVSTSARRGAYPESAVHQPRTHDQEGRRGCEPKEICCDLDCITAPRFFCGQLLTDQDLTALVEWARDKTRLSRYRHGWGVVCGLDVRCHPTHAGSVVIGPGYAVSCCGDDIVVCEDAEFDLSAACGDEIDPCGELERPRPIRVDRPSRSTGDIRRRRENQGTEEEAKARQPFDLYIAYDEQHAEPQPGLARGSCGEVGRCEYSRTRETFRVTWQEGGNGDPVTVAAERWRAGYQSTLEVLDKFQEAFGEPTGAETADVRRWLLDWIDRHPLHQFCSVRDTICEVDGEIDEPQLAEILFWLVQDARNAYLACACFSCEQGSGVPLARVWLEPAARREGGGCRVLDIDPYWPHRRELAPECWKAPPGSVNVAQLTWHREEQACTRLAELGVEVAFEELKLETVEDLREVLDDRSPFLKCGTAGRAVVYDAKHLRRRVVAIYPDGDNEPSKNDQRRPGQRTALQEPTEEDQLSPETPTTALQRIEHVGQTRAAALQAGGINTVADFADAEPERLGKLMKRVPLSTIESMQRHAKALTEEE